MEKLSDLLEMAKVSDIIATKKEKEDNKIVWALAIIGAIAAVAGIAFAVYKYLTPDYMDDFDEDFDDDFDDDDDDDDVCGIPQWNNSDISISSSSPSSSSWKNSNKRFCSVRVYLYSIPRGLNTSRA